MTTMTLGMNERRLIHSSGAPDRGYVWALIRRLTLSTPQRMCGKRIKSFGAVNTVTGRAYRMNSTAPKSESPIRFIEKLVSRHRGKTLWI